MNSKRAVNSLRLAASLICGLLVALIVYRLAESQPSLEGQASAGIPVVVAKAALTSGTIIGESSLELMVDHSPKWENLQGAFTHPRSVQGRIVKNPIPQGSPVLETSLEPPDRRGLVEGGPKKGHRAVDVLVDAQSGTLKLLKAGDRVDILVTQGTESRNPYTSSEFLLQNVEVLAVPEGKGLENSFQGKVPVTLSVTPRDAERLSLSMEVGHVSLLPRHQGDQEVVPTSGATPETLFPLPASSSRPVQPVLELPKGYRAIDVPVNAQGGILKLVKAGDRVDVLVTLEVEKGTFSTELLLQSVEVLAVADEKKREASGQEKAPVTLSVTPRDAERLSLAMEMGSVSLLPRHQQDSEIIPPSAVTPATLLPTHRSPTHKIEVIRGKERSIEQFPEVNS